MASTVREFRRVQADCSQEALFAAFTSLGGERGYLTFDWAWKLCGLLGLLYWWALYPMHLIMFTRMAKRITRHANTLEQAQHISGAP